MEIKHTGLTADSLAFLEPSETGVPISIQKNLQKTAPSHSLESSQPRQEAGDSGTRILHGIITEEYLSELQGIQGIAIYDKMRKSDGTVRAALLACTLPIRRAEWFIKDAGEDDNAKAQGEFIRHALFDWIEDMTFDDILRQALLMTAFGVMLFEKVYGTYKFEGKTYVTLQKFAPRLPKSILMWELADRTFGIQQIRQDGVLAQIPGSKLAIFVNEREGDNWWGTSMLRAAYQHWYRKSKYYAIDALGFERQALGVPFAKMPQGYTENDERKAEKVLSNLRANQRQFLVFPNTMDVGFLDMGAKTTRDPSAAIEHHNKEILQSVLAQFLELGAAKGGNTGSRALSQDHSDLFLKSMEAIANTIISVINRDVIRELIDLNFNNVEAYPVLDYNGIAKADVTAVGTAYAQLVTAGAITPTTDDQQYMRTLMGLPPLTQEQIDEQAEDEPDEESLDDPAPDEDAGNTDVEDAAGDAKDSDNATKGKKNAKPAPKGKPTKNKNGKPGTPEKPPQQHSHPHGARLKRTFNVAEGFASWRPLTASETKVDWGKMQEMMDKLQDDFTGPANDALTKAKNDYMTKVHALLTTGDIVALGALTIAFESKYKDILTTAMTQSHAYGRSTATQELGYGARPGASQSDLATIDMLAGAIASKTAADLNASAKIAIANAVKSDKPPLQAAGQIDKDLSDSIDKAITDTANIVVGQGINNGRAAVFNRNRDDIHGLQRSEILDDRTCNFCMSMDGRVVEADDDWASTDIFHSNCRGIWVAILNDEVNPPPVDGVPDNVADYWGGQTNELIQPKAPITKPGGLAEQYVKRQTLAKQ
jgi:phage gp29-like protein